jgi:hypothetical protein
MSTADLVAQHQRRLDAEYPQGAVCVWDGQEDSPVYQIPRIDVIGMHGDDPIVRLPVHGPDKVLGPARMMEYNITQRSPVTEARVQLAGMPAMRWSSGVGPILARAMAEDRARQLAAAPGGGMSAVE